MVQKDKKEKAFRLRLQGKSYGEILKSLDIPSKGTLSTWFRDLELPPAASKRLENKKLMAIERGLMTFNRKRTAAIAIENKKILSESLKEVPLVSDQHLLLIGAALYWGEGSNRENKRNLAVAFSNSDPEMARVFLKFVRRILKVPEGRIRAGVNIYPNLDRNKALRFWINVTKLPMENFHTSVQQSSASKSRRPQNFLPYGTLHIKINSRQLFYKVRGYIKGIISNLL